MFAVNHRPYTLFLHGQLDTTVPFTSSKELADQLLSKGGTRIETCFPLEVCKIHHHHTINLCLYVFTFMMYIKHSFNTNYSRFFLHSYIVHMHHETVWSCWSNPSYDCRWKHNQNIYLRKRFLQQTSQSTTRNESSTILIYQWSSSDQQSYSFIKKQIMTRSHSFRYLKKEVLLLRYINCFFLHNNAKAWF